MKFSFALLIAYLTFVYFEPVHVFPVLGEMRLALIIPILSFLSALVSGGRPPISGKNMLLLGLVAVAGLSLFLSPVPFNRFSEHDLAYFIKIAGLYFLICTVVSRDDYLLKYMYITILFVSVVSIVTIITTRTGIRGMKGGDLYRMVNFFGGIGSDSNEFGVLMLAMFPLPLCLISKEQSALKKVVLAVVSLSFLLCIIRTRSRGAFIGLIVVLFLLLIELRRNRFVLMTLALLVAYALFNTHMGYWERVGTIAAGETREEDYNVSSRIQQYRYALNLIERYPLTGVGIGNFVPAKIQLLGLHENEKGAGLVTHNSYLGLGAEMGLVGLAVFLGLYFFSLRDLMSSERVFASNAQFVDYHKLVKGMKIGLIGMGITIFFLSEQYNNILYQWMAISLLLKKRATGHPVIDRAKETPEPPAGITYEG